MDLDSTLDAIDEAAVHHCGHCDAQLGPEAPSTLFCDDECQAAFYEARSEALVGYKEPSDIPQHVYNQVEESDPEITPLRPVIAHCDSDTFLLGGSLPATGSFRIALHMSADDVEWVSTTPASENWARNGADGVHVSWGPPAGVDSRWLQIGLSDWSVSAEFQLDYEMTSVPFLAEQPEPPRLADQVERALEARRNRNAGPQPPRRAPRRIDPRRSGDRRG